MLHQLRLAIVGLACALVLLAASGGQALAHAALISTSPSDSAVVASAPGEFTLDFSEPVSPLVVKLVHPNGTTSTLDRYALKDRKLVVETPKGLGVGTYVLSWRVVSEDGHPVGGSVVFSIGAPSGRPSRTL